MTRELPSPRDPEYWEHDALIKEEQRVFQICNGCRLCWNLCPSFPRLFTAIDALDTESDPTQGAEKGGDPDGAHAAETRDDVMGQQDALQQLSLDVHQEVVDLCYGCKLCDPICPYQPPHEHAIDFPRLMLRHRAVKAKQDGVTLGDRVLGDPDLVGKLGTTMAPLANMANKNKTNRAAIESILGIHRDRKLPNFASEPFLKWYRKTHSNPPDPNEVPGKKVVLFYTCSVQWNEPKVGRAAVKVLERNGITVFCPEFHCCGMPALDGGDVDRAKLWMSNNVKTLLPFVEAGCDILSPGPTCSYMLKHEWHEYLGTDAAEKVANATYDLMEYLFKMRKAGELDEDFSVKVGQIGYHVPCHLKVQKIGFRSRDILKKLPGAQVKLVDRCSCMDGTWGMKKDYYDLSKEGAQKLIDDISDASIETLSSDCLIAKLQIEEGTNKEVFHPIEIMWKAYGGE